MGRNRVTMKFIIFTAFLFACTAGASWAADKGDVPVKVAVLPFSMHAPSELQYLQSGIRDMFSSRLSWQGKVEVIDRTATDNATRNKKGDISLAEATQIGASLKADYVLFGSVTALGRAII